MTRNSLEMFLCIFYTYCSFVSTYPELCQGSWSHFGSDTYNSTIANFYPHRANYRFSQITYTNSSIEPFLFESCPAETIIHNCYYHGKSEQMKSLQHRAWFTGPFCKPFWPVDFLETMRNRKLLLHGDSSMKQVWQALACHLYGVTESIFDIHWIYHTGGTNEVKSKIFNSITCPFNAIHCLFHHADVHFPHFNMSLHFRWSYPRWLISPSSSIFREALKYIVDLKLQVNDVVVLNFGLHYNVKHAYAEELEHFRVQLLEHRSSLLPHILFQESFRTHFATANGYYTAEATSCKPYGNTTFAFESDWRNRLLDEYLGNVIPIIRISAALESQWDAHIDGDSKIVSYSSPDCVHYCAHTGVFEYLKLILFNYILNISNS